MKTQTSMLSSIAMAALATITLNSSEALAKGGPSGMGGMSGMRTFSAVRTPMVVNKIKTVSTPTVRRLNLDSKRTVLKNYKLAINPQPLPARSNNQLVNPVGKISINPQPLPPGGNNQLVNPTLLGGGKVSINPQPLPPGGVAGGVVTPAGGGGNGVLGGIGTIQLPPGGGASNPPGGILGGIGTIQLPPSGVGTIPIKLPSGGGVLNPPTIPIHIPTGGVGGVLNPGGTGGTATPPPVVVNPPPVVVNPPPVVVNPPPVVMTPPPAPVSVGVGVAAPVAVDLPGCVYERSVRKLPGGGLQRVIVKICPDVVVQ
jgi:hypothetical protein